MTDRAYPWQQTYHDKIFRAGLHEGEVRWQSGDGINWRNVGSSEVPREVRKAAANAASLRVTAAAE